MKKVLAAAWPIILSYIPVGLACGVLGSKCGVGPDRALLLSLTIISGGGQFMIDNLWLAGVPASMIVVSVGAISLRFALYSASLAPHLQKAKKRMSLALALTLIEEAYGVSLGKFCDGDKEWTFAHALKLNLVTILTWASSVTAGAVLGGVVNVPTAVAGFAMTSLFIYLLWDQLVSAEGHVTRGKLVAAVAAVIAAVAFKLAGVSAAAVPGGAVAGVVAALLATKKDADNGGGALAEGGALAMAAAGANGADASGVGANGVGAYVASGIPSESGCAPDDDAEKGGEAA